MYVPHMCGFGATKLPLGTKFAPNTGLHTRILGNGLLHKRQIRQSIWERCTNMRKSWMCLHGS
jgi:hypothetical protein